MSFEREIKRASVAVHCMFVTHTHMHTHTHTHTYAHTHTYTVHTISVNLYRVTSSGGGSSLPRLQ